MSEKNIYRYTEKCLYEYRANVARIEVLMNDITTLRITGDVHAQNYDNPAGLGCGVRDPVFLHVQHIELLEQEIKRLQRITQPLTRMQSDLKETAIHEHSSSADSLKVLQEYYFAGVPLVDMLDLHKWSRSAFYKRRYALVKTSSIYLGL